MSLNPSVIIRQLRNCARDIYDKVQFRSNSIIIVGFFMMLLSTSSRAQQLNEPQATFAWLDQLIGIHNLPIHSGKVYEEAHRIKSKKSKFFLSPEFANGAVQFNSQYYSDLPLKYNIYDDELLLQIANKLGGNMLQIYKPNVQAFTIGPHHFVHISNSPIAKMAPGYYQLAFDRPGCSLFLKHRKLLKRALEDTQVFYEFEDLSSDAFLWYQNNYYQLKNVADLIEYFPTQESNLKTIKARFDKKISTTDAIIELLRYLEDQQAFEHSKLAVE